MQGLRTGRLNDLGRGVPDVEFVIFPWVFAYIDDDEVNRQYSPLP